MRNYILLFTLFCSGLYSAELQLTELAKQVRPAVFLVIVMDAKGNDIATGSGFLISADGKLITNHHVIERGASFIVKAQNGGAFKVEGILAKDSVNDLAMLKVQCNEMPFLKLGSSSNVEVGQKLAVVGSPLGLEGSLSEGIVSAIRDMPPTRWIQMTAAISHGSSGSPVLNSNAEVIGVAAASIVNGQALNIAIPVDSVKKLLEAPQPAAVQVLNAIVQQGKVLQEAVCNSCGGSGTVGNISDANKKWHGKWCQNCASGREMITECFQILRRVIDDNKATPQKNSGTQIALDSRKRTVTDRVTLLRSEVKEYENAKNDVRDVKARAEKKLKEAEQELEKLERDIEAASKQDRAGGMATDYSWGYTALDYLKKEMVIMGMQIPEKDKVSLPPFKIDTMDDLLIAARANLEARTKKAAAGSAAIKAAPPKTNPVYILKDGRRIKTKIAVEDGDNVILKTEENKMITISKKDIEGIGHE
jgi:hypothetical protein